MLRDDGVLTRPREKLRSLLPANSPSAVVTRFPNAQPLKYGMFHVLVYADSLTWGIIPNTRGRLPFEERWPGVLEKQLNDLGQPVRILEDCLNGRRTVWEDPFKPGRNGLRGLAQQIEAQSPLALVILMLGTNDFQFCHPYNNAWSAGQGVTSLINEIRQAPIEPGMPVPPVLLLSPPPIGSPQGPVAEKFFGAEKRCSGLAEIYRQVSSNLGCHFFDAGSVTPSSRVDGVHLDRDQHWLLGKALADVVAPILPATR
jgi:lysophospholipase L1-like esterase